MLAASLSGGDCCGGASSICPQRPPRFSRRRRGFVVAPRLFAAAAPPPPPSSQSQAAALFAEGVRVAPRDRRRVQTTETRRLGNNRLPRLACLGLEIFSGRPPQDAQPPTADDHIGGAQRPPDLHDPAAAYRCPFCGRLQSGRLAAAAVVPRDFNPLNSIGFSHPFRGVCLWGAQVAAHSCRRRQWRRNKSPPS